MENSKEHNDTTIDDFFGDGEVVNTTEIGNIKEPKLMPSYKESDVKKFSNSIDETIYSKSPKDKKLAIHLNTNNQDTCMCSDIGSRDDYGLVTNDVVHNGVKITSRSKKIDKRAKNAKTGLIKLRQKVGLGTPLAIPLYHSGFWVKIDVLTKEEIVNLEFDIIEKLNQVGKQTNTLAFSHVEVLFAEVILDVFEEKLLTTSLKLGDDDNIRDYIHINDIPIIAWYIATVMYPKGFQALIPCKESIKFDEDKQPKCSNMLKIKLDMEELVHTDKSKLSVYHLDIMSKKGSASVTVEDVIKYQETLPTSGVREYSYETTIDDEPETVYINLMAPVASKYIQYGQYFLDMLEIKTNKLVKDKDKLDKDTATTTILKLIELATYNHYVDGIPVDDTVLTELPDINESLEVYTNATDISSRIFKDIRDYIDESIITSIGIPAYTCTECKTEQTTQEYIPISVYNYFFTLLHSKYQKIASQIQEMMQKENIS